MFGVRVRLGLVAGLGFLTSANEVAAGAWTLEAGRGQVIVGATGSRADTAFGGSGNRQPTPRYEKIESQALIEYGVTDWLTALLAPGLQHIEIAAPVDARRTGLGYSEAGVRARLLQDRSWVFSAQTTVRIPGTSDNANPAAIGYTGAEVDVRALFGLSFSAGRFPAFVDLQVAQRFRTDSSPNEVRADVTLGIRPAPAWLVLAQSFNVISEGAGSPLFPSYEYYKLQMGIVYEWNPRWSLQLGAFSTYAGRNALQENGMLLGAWYKF